MYMIILKAQKISLTIQDKKTGELHKVQGFQDIGSAWKLNTDPITATKINTIINSIFTENSRYKYYLETQIMKNFKLKYAGDLDINRSIACMIIMRKCQLGKVINKRSEKTYQKKIVKIRMKNNDDQIKCSERMKTNLFRINTTWFNDDDSQYTKTKDKLIDKEDNALFYIEKIKKLEEFPKQTNQVEYFFYFQSFKFRFVLISPLTFLLGQ